MARAAKFESNLPQGCGNGAKNASFEIREGEGGCLFDEIQFSSNRSNAETWMTRQATARQEQEQRGPESRLRAAVVESMDARTARPDD